MRVGGKGSETVLTDVGPVEIVVPRDRDGSFEPKIFKKRHWNGSPSSPTPGAGSIRRS